MVMPNRQDFAQQQPLTYQQHDDQLIVQEELPQNRIYHFLLLNDLFIQDSQQNAIQNCLLYKMHNKCTSNV